MHEPVVEARLYGVRKKFGNFTAVDGIDLEVQRGEFFSLLGLSGCGKTTSLRSLGAGPWTAFRTVTLPLIYPGILAGVLLAFASTTTSPPASTPVRP